MEKMESQWRFNYFAALINNDLPAVRRFSSEYGVNVRFSADLCEYCSYFETFVDCKPSSNSDEEVQQMSGCSCMSTSVIDTLLKGDDNLCSGVRPIHVACGHGLVDLVMFLLSCDAEVNVRTVHTDLTPIQLTVFGHQPSRATICRCLVEHGAHVDVVNSFGSNPIHTAIKYLDADLVEALVSRQTNCIDSLKRALAMSNEDGDVPLHMAIRRRSPQLTELILNAGSDVNMQNSHGALPLVLAVRYNDCPTLKVLLKEENVSRAGLNAALVKAVQRGLDESVSLLLEAGADPNNFSDNMTPLILAAFCGRAEIAQLLINAGANVDATCSNGYSALHHAAWEGKLNVAQLLLKVCQNDDMKTTDGNTPLSLACHGAHPSIVALLLSRGCIADNTDKDQDTPLMYACFNGDLASVKLLMEYGADVHATNRVNATPVWNACYSGNVDLLKYMLSNSCPSLSVASRGIDQQAAGTQAEMIYDVDRTPLFVALDCRMYDVADLLLASGVEMKDESWYWRNDFPDFVDCHVCDKLHRLARNVRPLLILARDCIRRCLDRKLPSVVPLLDLPHTLKDMLLLEE